MNDYSKITALYSRLSVGDEDRDGGESNSIQNQKSPFFCVANPHSECNRILRGSRPGATYDDACEDMHHWRHHGRLQPS